MRTSLLLFLFNSRIDITVRQPGSQSVSQVECEPADESQVRQGATGDSIFASDLFSYKDNFKKLMMLVLIMAFIFNL